MNEGTIVERYKQGYDKRQSEEMPLLDFFNACKDSSSFYASPQERLIRAISKPELVDTREDDRLGRIFQNRTIKVYPAFSEFFGIESVIEDIVSFLTRASQGLHEKKKIMYLLGPAGGGKSSLAEKLKQLMEEEPIWVLKADGVLSPVFESALGLFASHESRRVLVDEYGIPDHCIPTVMSPWAAKRLSGFEGHINQFTVEKVYPSILNQVAIAVTEPGDENNQDASSLVGKTNIRALEEFSQDDPDSYSFSGGLCRGNQGMLEFREMFKASIKTLQPLLFATQDHNYQGTEAIGALPFDGIIIAHSNEAEWEKFKNNRTNEAFIDRTSLIRIPYSLRVDEEILIYEKMLGQSSLGTAPLAPHTLKMLAKFIVSSRLADPKNSKTESKLRVYNGENIKDTDPKAKKITEYRDEAGVNEGMTGISPRFAFEVIAKTFNLDPHEIGADPVHLLFVLEDEIMKEQFERQKEFLSFLKGFIVADYFDEITKEIQRAYFGAFDDYGQNLFERYIQKADYWMRDEDYVDPDTLLHIDRGELNEWLEEIEKPAGITNSKDFRSEVVSFVHRYQARNKGKHPRWQGFEKMKKVIEAKLFSKVEDLLPIISFGQKRNDEEQEKHEEFVLRMMKNGAYSEKQVQRVSEWFTLMHKSS